MAEIMVPRGGIEPPTPAFSVRLPFLKVLENSGTPYQAPRISRKCSREHLGNPVQLYRGTPHLFPEKMMHKCPHCPRKFKTVGGLIEHCNLKHAGQNLPKTSEVKPSDIRQGENPK